MFAVAEGTVIAVGSETMERNEPGEEDGECNGEGCDCSCDGKDGALEIVKMCIGNEWGPVNGAPRRLPEIG